MSGGLVTAAYIVAAILFIFSLAGLSKHETSQQGNNFGIAGMAIALIATIFGPDTGNVAWILVAMIIGGAIGIRLAKKVEMTEMPELVAILHSFVGLAAVLVGFNSYLYHEAGLALSTMREHMPHIDTRVAAIFRHDRPIRPQGSTIVEAGDEVFFIAASQHIRAVMSELQRLEKPYKRIMLVGGGLKSNAGGGEIDIDFIHLILRNFGQISFHHPLHSAYKSGQAACCTRTRFSS